MRVAHVAMTHRSGSSHLRGAAESHVHDRRRVRAVISALTTAAVQNPWYVFSVHSISNFLERRSQSREHPMRGALQQCICEHCEGT